MTNTPKIIISTKRLLLRTWQASDIPLMAAISADPKVMEFFPSLQDYAATEQLIDKVIRHQAQHGYSLYAVEIRESHEFIGFVGLFQPQFDIPHFIPHSLPIVEIGWRLAKAHWGKGYATEAAKAVLDYAFTELNLNEIISFTAEVNLKSRNVMEKIGLHYDTDDNFNHPKITPGSQLERHVLYRLNRDEWTT